MLTVFESLDACGAVKTSEVSVEPFAFSLPGFKFRRRQYNGLILLEFMYSCTFNPGAIG